MRSRSAFALAIGAMLASCLTLAAVRGSASAATVESDASKPLAPSGEATTNDVPDVAGREATQKRIDSLAKLLARIAEEHGADAVALQSRLLIETIRAGAIGPSEVRVAGPSPREGEDYLEIDVLTGLIFDSDSTDERSRLDHVWQHVAAPALQGMKSFDMKPKSLELVIDYGTQRFADHVEHRADPSEPADMYRVRIAIPEAVLSDLVVAEVAAADALEQCRVAHEPLHDPPVPE
jgi:hypothetical protein